MKALSNRDKKLLFILAGLLVFLALYMLVVSPLQTRRDTLSASNAQLQTQLNQLEQYYQELAKYEAGIEEYRKTVGETLSAYPSDIKEEDILSYLLTMESREGISLESVSFNTPSLVTAFPGILEEDGGDTPHDMSAYRTDALMTCQLTYPQLKRVVDYFYGSEKQTVLDSVSVSYSSEANRLTGSFAISKFYIQWPERPYYPEPLPPATLGVGDLFGTTSAAAVPAVTPAAGTPAAPAAGTPAAGTPAAPAAGGAVRR